MQHLSFIIKKQNSKPIDNIRTDFFAEIFSLKLFKLILKVFSWFRRVCIQETGTKKNKNIINCLLVCVIFAKINAIFDFFPKVTIAYGTKKSK